MKYAKEVISLMSAYPHKEFKMATLVKVVNPDATQKERNKIRTGILRVLESLKDSNHIQEVGESCQSKRYRWVV